MSHVLGIDTSAMVSAGIARDGWVLASGSVRDTRAHVEQLMPLVARVVEDAGLRMSDIDRIAVGVGPGPFTGLRVGVVAATTLAAALGIEARGVCSLDVLASQAVADEVIAEPADSGEFVVATDARRKEYYWARYDGSGRRLDGPRVGQPQELPSLPVVGTVAGTLLELDASRLAAVADHLPDAGLEPLYLRRPDADVPTTRKSTLVTPRLARRPR